jgi:hypothetical protein
MGWSAKVLDFSNHPLKSIAQFRCGLVVGVESVVDEFYGRS